VPDPRRKKGKPLSSTDHGGYGQDGEKKKKEGQFGHFVVTLVRDSLSARGRKKRGENGGWTLELRGARRCKKKGRGLLNFLATAFD